jgi:hypothetical protein
VNRYRLLPVSELPHLGVESGTFMLGREPQMIADLRQAGFDPNRPHDIDHYLYFPSEESATRAVERLPPKAYHADVKPHASAAGDSSRNTGSRPPLPTRTHTSARCNPTPPSSAANTTGGKPALLAIPGKRG